MVQDVHLTLPIGTIIRDRYLIEDLLGKGGYGSVYLVRDKRVNGNLFALKELIDPNKQERDRFTFECEVLRRLDHPFLPRVYRAFSDDANIRAYMLMDYIDGANLEVLRQKQPDKCFPLSQVISMMAPIVAAISYLHNQQPPIIHRDIKPANIIVPTTGEEAMLVDFGIAKEYEPDSTTTTVRRCSPGYGAPEQYSSGTNTRTDIYGLGATIYALLTGVVPADAFYRMIQLGSNWPDSLEPITKLVPSIPVPVADAIHRAMSININSRFSSVEDFWQDLTATAKNPETTVPARQAVILSSTASSSSIVDERPEGETVTTASEPLIVSSTDAPVDNSSHPYEVTTAAESRPLPPQPSAQFPARQQLRPERSPASRTRRIGIVLVITLLLLLIGGGIGTAFGLYYTRQPVMGNASRSQTATAGHTQTPKQHSTATAAATTRTSTPQNGRYIAGTYNGSMSSGDGHQPTILITIVVQQTQGSANIGGTFTYKTPTQGSYPLTGTIDAQGNFSFTVQLPAGQTPLYFYGSVQSGTYLHGNYCSSSTNHCDTNTLYFNVGPRF